MKCAKCGRDVPVTSQTCPWCAAGFRMQNAGDDRVHCPVCGSTDISAVRRNYSPGCGCLGLLIFGWWGLLMGLLGAGKVDLVCHKCGAQWEAGKPVSGRNSGCLCVLLLVILILLLKLLFKG